MTLQVIKAVNRMGHYLIGCRIVGRYCRASATVTGVLLQAYGVEPCFEQNRHYYHKSSSTAYQSTQLTSRIAAATAVVLVLGSAGYYMRGGSLADHRSSVLCESADMMIQAGRRRPDLPDYRLNDISQHKTAETGVWVTYRDGVYDITDFMIGHPGGDRIHLAAGGSIEPFWDLYAIHRTEHVYEILETLRIGNVHVDEMASVVHSSAEDPYSHEPRRHPALRVHASKPFNAETPAQLLVDQFITPNDLFYVRNHLPVPRSAVTRTRDKPSTEVELTGVGLRRPVSLSVADLRRKFTAHTMTTTIPCAGNRRLNMLANSDRTVRGLPWGVGAVGTARWTGVLLSDVLKWVGAREEDVKHVLFQGRDKDHEGQPYETSIPAATAFDPRREVLLAYEMNGGELPVDHGYPLRLIVPGTVGARQVKWLRRVILSRDESQSFWQQKDYKTVNPSTNWDTVDLSKVMAIQEFPVQASICSPLDGTTVDIDEGEVTVCGYAMSGGGRGIQRVDVTVDGGRSWYSADLHAEPQPYGRQWAWTIWQTTVPLPSTTKPGDVVEIAVKATDTSHNTQPETDLGIWNIRGLLENRWHRVHVSIISHQSH